VKRVTLFAGALMVGPAMGAIASQAVNTHPVDRSDDVFAAIPQHEIAYYDNQQAPSGARDHYPLITPHGRVEVEELWDHGLMRNRRFARYDTYEPEPPPQPEPYAEVPVEDARLRNANYQSVPAAAALTPSNARSARQIGERMERPRVSARMIDVAAELARTGRGEPLPVSTCRQCSDLQDTVSIRPAAAKAVSMRSDDAQIGLP
jgi:hypothetical protein